MFLLLLYTSLHTNSFVAAAHIWNNFIVVRVAEAEVVPKKVSIYRDIIEEQIIIFGQ